EFETGNCLGETLLKFVEEQHYYLESGKQLITWTVLMRRNEIPNGKQQMQQ
ncbi:hypothetical protein KI387_028229, partial [Taxus chinensis]